MPKPYILGVEVEEAALGKIMRKINALPGVLGLHMDFRKPAKGSAKPNGKAGVPRPQYEGTGEAVIHKLLKGGKVASKQRLRAAFIAQGRSPKSIDSLIHKMQKAGTLLRKDRDTFTAGKPKK